MLHALDAPSCWTHTAEPDMPESQALALDSRLARRTLGWTDRLRGQPLIDATASWYHAWARGRNMLDYTLGQISAYEALP
jgi:hypothetical protein